MAASTFDRDIAIKNPASVKKFFRILNSDAPKKPISKHPYSESERGEKNY
jgi:hypothetical protein